MPSIHTTNSPNPKTPTPTLSPSLSIKKIPAGIRTLSKDRGSTQMQNMYGGSRRERTSNGSGSGIVRKK